MKKLILITIMFGFLLSCDTKKSNGPEGNAEKFLIAIGSAEFDEAKNIVRKKQKLS